MKRATGVRWVADLRDSLVAHPHRDAQRLIVRMKEQGQGAVASVVARNADAIVTVSDAIADGDARAFAARAGADDRERLRLRRLRRARVPPGTATAFRITHAGSFFGKRDPRPFLTALARVDGVVARFVGDFRCDRPRVGGRASSTAIELIPYAPHRRALELQRDSEALLLLIPEAGGRGRGVLSGKVFEYLAAERPILALVPPDGAAAELLRETGAGVVVAPEDIDGIDARADGAARPLACRRARRRRRSAANGATSVSRRTRVEELAEPRMQAHWSARA